VIDLATRISPNFTLAELTRSEVAARRGLPNIPGPAAIASLTTLCERVLEPLRARVGPIYVNSGFRSVAVNKAVGGVPTSQHCLGEAADIECPALDNVELARAIEAHCQFDQLILEFHTPGQPRSGWVHVSYRDGRLRRSVLTVSSRGTERGIRP